ncbi:MAG: hypothetical protein QM772_18890 [Ottowia sp.]|uniref:hypothetical protein n=1 Tax=Ottowia sp. TaxID=1898956 RepID=UPI0039E2E53D
MRTEARPDEEYALPGVEALLAGTLALMTGVAQAAPGGDSVGPMAAKIVANLGLLADHPSLSDPMRQMLARLVVHWQGVAHEQLADAPVLPERALWLRSPATLQ